MGQMGHMGQMNPNRGSFSRGFAGFPPFAGGMPGFNPGFMPAQPGVYDIIIRFVHVLR